MRNYILLFLIIHYFILNTSGQTTTPKTISEKRIALVIGNGNYLSSMLANPENDARSMAEVLRKMGFKVFEYENLNQGQMKKAIDDFGLKIKGNDVSLFYYAGHGIQAKGFNYIIPVDAQLKTEEQVEYDCVRADRIMALMEKSGTKVNIIILDACRNNPFERSWTRAATGRGLAFMNAPGGTLIAYATAPGSTASDGSGKNGLYTSAILESIQTPGLTIIQVFQQVRKIVAQKSNNQQIPWESTSLTGDFYFNTKSPAVTSSVKPSVENVPVNTPENSTKIGIPKSSDNEAYPKFNPALRDFMLAAYYLRFPPESFTESYLKLGENIKSIEEFERLIGPDNSTLLNKEPKQEIKMFYDRNGLPVKRITYGIGGRDTTFITYKLDSLNSLTGRSRSFNFNNGRKYLGSYDNMFRIQDDSVAMYYQNGTKLADYGFFRTSLKYMKTFNPDKKITFVYSNDGHMINEIHSDKASEKATSDNNSKGNMYKYLEFDNAGNWTKRYALNSNGYILLERREYTYY